MRKHIQHPRAARQTGGKGVVGALVIEQAGFLPAHQIGHIGRAVHRHRDRAINGTTEDRHVLVQTFQRARAPRAVFDNGGHARDGLDRRRQGVDPRLGPCGVGLNHHRVAKAVDDHTGQAVGLGMDQTVERRIKQGFAQRQRGLQAGFEPRLIDRRGHIAVQHPTDDLGIRVHRNQTHLATFVILEDGNRTGA